MSMEVSRRVICFWLSISCPLFCPVQQFEAAASCRLFKSHPRRMHGRTPAHLECRLSISFTFLIDFLCARPHAHIPHPTSHDPCPRPHADAHTSKLTFTDRGTRALKGNIGQIFDSSNWICLLLPFRLRHKKWNVVCLTASTTMGYMYACCVVLGAGSWLLVAGSGFLGQGVGSGTGECADEGVPGCQGVNTFGFCLLPPEKTRRFVSLLIDCWASPDIRPAPYLPSPLCGEMTSHTHTCHSLLWHFRYILFQFAPHQRPKQVQGNAYTIPSILF